MTTRAPRIFFFPHHNGTTPDPNPDGALVEAASQSEARKILVEHLYAEPRVATQAELIRLTKANVEVVRAGE
jgi:hypothetical protein